MRLQVNTVRLVNFRSFEDRTFTLGERTFLAGLNGAGKSTVIDAILWGILGVCRGTDARGAGSKDLIRSGADAASVTLGIENIGPITRTISHNGGGGCTVKPEAILAKLGTTAAAVESVCYGRAFFGLHHKDARDLLLRILDVRIPETDLPGVGLTEPADLDTLELLYKTAFDARAAAKKVLASIQVPELPKVVALDHNSEGLATRAMQARADERQAAASLAALASELHNVVISRQRLTPVNVDAVNGSRKVHEDMLATETQAGIDAAAKVDALTAKMGLTQAEIGARIQDRKNLIVKVQAHDPNRGCVLNTLIPCHTDAALFAAQVKALKTEVKALGDDLKKGAALANELAQATKAKADSDQAVAYHRNQIDQIADKLAKADEIDEAISRLDQEKARLETAIAQAKVAQDETIRVSSDLAEQVSGAVAYQAAVVARQTADDKRARQAAEVDRLEGLVTVLGPKGVRATALQNAVVDFEAAINVGLDAFGFRLSFTVDPWDVRISRDGGQTWLRFDLLSDGEKLWTGACFQQALAVVTGLEFVAVDATETVVGANRAMLTRLIMLSPVSQIVVAMAKGEGDPLPEIDGLTVVQI